MSEYRFYLVADGHPCCRPEVADLPDDGTALRRATAMAAIGTPCEVWNGVRRVGVVASSRAHRAPRAGVAAPKPGLRRA